MHDGTTTNTHSVIRHVTHIWRETDTFHIIRIWDPGELESSFLNSKKFLLKMILSFKKNDQSKCTVSVSKRPFRGQLDRENRIQRVFYRGYHEALNYPHRIKMPSARTRGPVAKMISWFLIDMTHIIWVIFAHTTPNLVIFSFTTRCRLEKRNPKKKHFRHWGRGFELRASLFYGAVYSFLSFDSRSIIC